MGKKEGEQDRSEGWTGEGRKGKYERRKKERLRKEVRDREKQKKGDGVNRQDK